MSKGQPLALKCASQCSSFTWLVKAAAQARMPFSPSALSLRFSAASLQLVKDCVTHIGMYNNDVLRQQSKQTQDAAYRTFW